MISERVRSYGKGLLQLLRASHPNHRRIASSIISVAVFATAARLISAAKEVAVAWHYGVSATLDAYILAYTVATWLPATLLSLGTVILVPRLVSAADSPGELRGLVAELNGTALLLAAAAGVLVVAAGPFLMAHLSHKLSAQTLAMAQSMLWQLAPVAALTVLIGALSLRLIARERHSNAFMDALPALGILTCVALSPASLDPGPLVWGTVVGTALHALALARLARQSDGTLGGLAVGRRSKHWQGTSSGLGVMALGVAVMSLMTPIDLAFAANIGDGAIAALGYANRLISLVMAICAISLARALLPVLATARSTSSIGLGRAQTLKWAVAAFLAGGAIALLLWVAAPWLVTILFQRGSFTGQHANEVTKVLLAGLAQLPFYLCGIVLVQWLSVLGRYNAMLAAAIAAISAKLAFNVAFIDSLGASAILLSTAAAYAASLAISIRSVLRATA